ncbi:hypothetical protein OWV82_012499 [Melia azedarach]|uniref:Uncharacterized protein n=1 Tax=Melia azedarach TaxID=155640 RepID=A0ACC1Y3R2_MELAZ|nr:hypothetical protein OWV82_012499 [Melia azedarach]
MLLKSLQNAAYHLFFNNFKQNTELESSYYCKQPNPPLDLRNSVLASGYGSGHKYLHHPKIRQCSRQPHEAGKSNYKSKSHKERDRKKEKAQAKLT